MRARISRLFVSLLVTAALPAAAYGQSASAAPAKAAQGTAAGQPDPDLRLVPGEPDFALGALPTSLRMPAGQFEFRLTHRFNTPIDSGTVGDFFSNFFEFDGGATVGLELRYGVRPGTQVTVQRTSTARTIQFLGLQEIVGQSDSRPLTADAVVAVQGQNNFRQTYATTVGGIVSRRFGDQGSLYVEPLGVFNVNPAPVAGGPTSKNTFMLGIGGRLRLGKSRAYVFAEAAPRLGGYDAGMTHVSFGIEKRVGGHMFQFNISDGLQTTLAQVAQGGPAGRHWFIGFNLTRRFF